HLVSGIVAGIVVAIMSFTGAAIAFEQEILAWVDRDVARVDEPTDGRTLTLDHLFSLAAEKLPGFSPDSVTLDSDPQTAWLLRKGRDESYYLNPYTGELAESRSGSMHDFLHLLEYWHRWLGMEGTGRSVGRAITGACNLAFLFLAVSGLYLWFPKKWSMRSLRGILWFKQGLQSKARDFNWHNVIGFWTAPMLIVLIATAVVMSYGWANNLVYLLSGDEPPEAGQRGPRGGPSVMVEKPETAVTPLPLDALRQKVEETIPDWKSYSLPIPGTSRSSRGGPERAAPDREDRSRTENKVAAISVRVSEKGAWPLFASTTLNLNPFTGDIVNRSDYKDLSSGRKARSWVRFLHTGAAFGFIGKVIATLVSLTALVLVWTGFALTWRRFFKRSAKPQVSG
ncbi:MAG: PepSY domain-containing protein, partial [Verrucomicrobiae bacterium]|nr:PepSY domain-containing protein [Verrucomicrobiae bacterium]